MLERIKYNPVKIRKRTSLMKKAYLLICTAILAFSGNAAELFQQFQPPKTSRVRENTEWSITYTYNARDTKNPRLLLIGDSICNGYQGTVRNELGKNMNITFWATSKCVTDKDFFRELDLILSGCRYDVISFNNGLHSLTTDRREWENAFRNAVRFIRKKCPAARLILTNNTPLRDPVKTAQAKELNRIIGKTAGDEKLLMIDLFSLLDPLDRKKYWRDTYHFSADGVKLQADLIVRTVRNLPNAVKSAGNIVQQETETGPNGALK